MVANFTYMIITKRSWPKIIHPEEIFLTRKYSAIILLELHCSWSDYHFFLQILFWVFASGPRDQGSVPGRVIPNTQKMVLDASLLNSQYYKVRIKGNVAQSKEWSSALPYTVVL